MNSKGWYLCKTGDKFKPINGGILDKDGKRQGEFIFKWENGDVYEGNYNNDVEHGYGKMTWIVGMFTRVIGKMVFNTVTESTWEMEMFTRATIKMLLNTVMESLLGQMGKRIRVNGETEIWLIKNYYIQLLRLSFATLSVTVELI